MRHVKIPNLFRPRPGNPRSIMGYLPVFSLVCLVVARTLLEHTRYADGLALYGTGVLTVYSVAAFLSRYFPDAFAARKPEESDLQTLNLGR